MCTVSQFSDPSKWSDAQGRWKIIDHVRFAGVARFWLLVISMLPEWWMGAGKNEFFQKVAGFHATLLLAESLSSSLDMGCALGKLFEVWSQMRHGIQSSDSTNLWLEELRGQSHPKEHGRPLPSASWKMGAHPNSPPFSIYFPFIKADIETYFVFICFPG